MSNINVEIHPEWSIILNDEFQSEYFKRLKSFLVQEKSQHIIYPAGKQILSAFNLTPLSKVKVVVIGQDPYHGPSQAHGLCFSVSEGVPHPPSLRNIFKELNDDIGMPYPKSGNLEPWAKQGVFLLNATLTVRAHQAGSHQKKGWENFTDAVIQKLSKERQGLVFLLWGNFAIAKTKLIDTEKHYILTSVHPSPLSAYRGFFGCKHFSKTNEILEKQQIIPIDWTIK